MQKPASQTVIIFDRCEEFRNQFIQSVNQTAAVVKNPAVGAINCNCENSPVLSGHVKILGHRTKATESYVRLVTETTQLLSCRLNIFALLSEKLTFPNLSKSSYSCRNVVCLSFLNDHVTSSVSSQWC